MMRLFAPLAGSVLLMSALLPAANAVVPTVAPATRPALSRPAAIVPLTGEIDEYNKDAFERRFNAAKAAGAKVIIIQIDTYGGLVVSGLDISRFIKNQPDDICTIALVSDKAISAGAMIAMSCNQIYMNNDAVIGDCAPIMVDTERNLVPLPTAERAKMQSPIIADFDDSARRNGRDVLLAEAMVRIDAPVYWLESPEGKRKFVGEDEHKTLLVQGWKPVDPALDPVVKNDQLLTVHTAEAIELGLASGRADSPEALAEQQNLRIIASFEPGLGERLIDFLNQGPVRMVLMIILAISIYIFLHAPGHGMAEAAAVLSLGLLVGVPLLTGYANWWEILLIFFGLGIIAVEIFVLPHAGLLAAVGVLMMICGFVLTFVGPGIPGGGVWPQIPQTWTLLVHGLSYVVGALVSAIIIAWWISRYLPRLPIFNRLVLTAVSGGTTLSPTPQSQSFGSGWRPALGLVGRTVTPLRPGGTAEFFDESSGDSRVVIVSSEAGYIEAGASVIVREVDAAHVKVRAL